MRKIFLLVAAILSVPIGALCQQARDITQQVLVGNQLMSYDAALPLATKLLDGNVEEQKKAVAVLKEYGVSLKGTPALDKLVRIVEKKDDFAALDGALETSPDGNSFLVTQTGKSLADLFEIKSNALTALVMSGSERGNQLLNDYLSSKSASYRMMADDAQKAHQRDDTWTRGKQPTKKQPKLFSFDGQGIQSKDYVKAITQALDSGDVKKLHLAITSLSAPGNAIAIKDTDVIDRLFYQFSKAGEQSDEASRNLKLSVIRILHQSGDKRAGEFIKSATDDNDEIVRQEASKFLD